MPKIECTHIEVYLFRRVGRRVQFLALRRSKGRSLGGVWQPVTGKLRRGESAAAAARREVMEETGIKPRQWWALETMTMFFEPSKDAIRLLPLFAAELRATDCVRLSREHDAARFVGVREAARRFLWDSQRRGLDAVRREVLRGGTLERALRIPAGVAQPVKAARTMRSSRRGRRSKA
jgi:dihydroneopterin triphosphate diphosphatase